MRNHFRKQRNGQIRQENGSQLARCNLVINHYNDRCVDRRKCVFLVGMKEHKYGMHLYLKCTCYLIETAVKLPMRTVVFSQTQRKISKYK